MTLAELSGDYVYAAKLLRERLREIRFQIKHTTDPEQLFRLGRRKAVLTQMLTQTYELAELTAHYYERDFYRNEKYCL